jgi:hypothetical protein
MSTSTIHSVGELALFHDLGAPGRSRDNSALRAFVAGQFLALDHAHKVAGRLDLEHLLFLEANAAALLSAAHAEPLLALHGNDLLAPWQMLGQGVAPGMLALREALSPRRDLGSFSTSCAWTPGSSSKSSICPALSFSLFGPYFLSLSTSISAAADSRVRRSTSCALCASALDERSRFLRQTLKIDAGNRFQRHLLISCLAISNKHDT